MPLNCTLKIVKIINLMLCICHCNKKERENNSFSPQTHFESYHIQNTVLDTEIIKMNKTQFVSFLKVHNLTTTPKI